MRGKDIGPRTNVLSRDGCQILAKEHKHRSVFSLTRLKCSGNCMSHLLFRSLTLHLRTNFERVLYDPHNLHKQYNHLSYTASFLPSI